MWLGQPCLSCLNASAAMAGCVLAELLHRQWQQLKMSTFVLTECTTVGTIQRDSKTATCSCQIDSDQSVPAGGYRTTPLPNTLQAPAAQADWLSTQLRCSPKHAPYDPLHPVTQSSSACTQNAGAILMHPCITGIIAGAECTLHAWRCPMLSKRQTRSVHVERTDLQLALQPYQPAAAAAPGEGSQGCAPGCWHQSPSAGWLPQHHREQALLEKRESSIHADRAR